MTSDLEDSLVSMALAGHVTQIRDLFSASKESPSEELVQRLLAAATKSSHLGVVAFLLRQHPSVSLTEEIVRGAVNTGSIGVLGALLTHDPSIINMQFDRRGTPLVVACMGRQRVEFLQFLLEAGADPNQDPDGATFPLALVAALYSDPAAIDLLLQHDACLDHSGALAAAARRGNKTMVLHLLQHGASPRSDGPLVVSRSSDTPLHTAVKFGHLEIVKILLQYGADPTITDAGGATPVEVAEEMKLGGKEVSKMLEALEECRNSKHLT